MIAKAYLSILVYLLTVGSLVEAQRSRGKNLRRKDSQQDRRLHEPAQDDHETFASEASRKALASAYDYDEAVPAIGIGDHFCGTPSPDSAESVKTEALTRLFQESQVAETGRRAALCDGCIVIDTYFHVITEDDGIKGFISNETINTQMDVLNEAFAGSPFQFQLRDITRTKNSTLFRIDPSQENSVPSLQAALAYHVKQGDRETLNIYTATFRPVTLGVSTFPTAFSGIKDGVYLDYCTLPGGSCPPFSTGEIPAHEVGHWLGLLHVFEGGCDEEKGDHVSDTPPQARAILSCEKHQPSKSCPNSPDPDPLDNYMGYSAGCFHQFSPGQWERMYDQWYIYREGSGGCDDDEGILSIEIKLDSNPEDNFWRLYHGDGQLITLASFGKPEKGSTFNAQICLPYGSPLYFGFGDTTKNGFATSLDSYCRLFFDGKPLKDDQTFEAWAGAAFTMVDDTGCPHNEGLVVIELLLDEYPEETTWRIEDKSGIVIYAEDKYKLFGDSSFFKHSSVRRELCLAPGKYSFVIQDSYGDGLGVPGPDDTPFFRITASGKVFIDETKFFGEEQTAPFVVQESLPRAAPGLSHHADNLMSFSLKPSCPDQQPCFDMGNGWFAYNIFNVNNTDGTCTQRCSGGSSLSRYLGGAEGYQCGQCVQPSCPEQEPCYDSGDGLLGYSVHQVNEKDGTCIEQCAGGTTLAEYLFAGTFQCGKCIHPTCPGQEPCKDFENGIFGYSINRVNTTDGSCTELCAGGNDLTLSLSNGYQCGNCVYPSCPDQEPCKDLGEGLFSYSIHSISTQDGSCEERCTAGDLLTKYLISGNYICGKCPKPTCPGQDPCLLGNGDLGFFVFDNSTATCHDRCVTGNTLATALFSGDWECGTCPPVSSLPASSPPTSTPPGSSTPTSSTPVSSPPVSLAPNCPGQESCHTFEDGIKGYSIHKVNATDGTCKGYCAGGPSLTVLIGDGYECGPCEFPTCPDQEPCATYSNGLSGYSIINVTTEGTKMTCRQVCTGGNKLAGYLSSGDYSCGMCQDLM